MTFDLICQKGYYEKLQPQPNFFKDDYSRIRNKLVEVNWVETLSGNFEKSYGLFIEILTLAMEGNVPNRTPVRKNIRLKNKKQKLWKRYTFTRNIADYEKFVRSKNHLRSLTRTVRMNFEINLEGRSKKRPKQFWSYVKSKLQTRTNIPTLIKSNGSEARTSKEKAGALNEYFGSVYKEESNDYPSVAKNSNVPLSSINITDVMVLCKLRALHPGKSTCLDGWHPYFFI